MKAVIYARYSCDHQREESIEGQLRECKEYADKNNITVIGSYIDRAMSAKTDNRPQFQQMIKDSGKQLFDAIIVWKLDRFARNMYDSAHYKALLRKNGVKVVSATEVISEGAEGIILESVLEGFAEYYSAELSEKVIRGLKENALKCQWNGSPVPIGYVIDDKKHYQLDPLTAPFVKDAFEMYASGRTVKDIVEYLNSKGVKSSYKKDVTKTTVAAMLKNTKYRGQYKYMDVVIEGGVPRIVSDELFQKVQDRVAKNKQSRSRFKAKVEYFLSTKMICSDCGAMMVGECGTSKNGVVHNYYKCSNVKNRKGCHRPSIKKELAEKLVLEKVMTEMFTDDMIEDIADSVMALQKRENTAIPLLKEQLAEVEKGIENMLNAMQAGILTKSTKKRLDDLEAQKEKLEIDIMREGLQQEILTRDMVVRRLQQMKELDLSVDDNKRILIDTFVNSIQVFDDRLIVSFNNREGESEVSLLTGGCSAGRGLGELQKPENTTFSGFYSFITALLFITKMAKYNKNMLPNCRVTETVYRKFLALYVRSVNSANASCIVRGVQQRSRMNHKMANESLIKTDKSFSDLKLSLKERISDWLFEEYYSLFKSNGYKYSKDFDDEIPFKCLCKDRAGKILPVREASLSKTCE